MDNKNKRYQYLNGVKFKGFPTINWDNVFQYIYIIWRADNIFPS